MSNDVLNMLIEGYDPSKIEQEEQQYDKAWKEILGAYQNRTIIQGDFVAIEDLRQPKKEADKKDDKAEPETDEENESKWETVTCAVVQFENIRGYIPINEFGVKNKRQLRAFTGRRVNFKVLKYDLENEIFIGSRTQAQEQLAKLFLNQKKVGDTVLAIVNSVSPNLVRADVGGIEVKLPIDDIRYGWIDDLTKEVKVGDHLNVKVLEIDKEKQEMKVSRKALLKNPYPDCLQRYKKGNEYVGTVSGVREYGIFVNLEDGVDSLARHLKFENVQKGDRVLVRILSIDAKKEHISVSITRVIQRG